jgi:toxin ParE1/3/4
MRKISWSPLAREDLRRIREWLRTESSPDVAVRYLRAIRIRCAALEKFPERGPQIDDNVRKLLVPDTPYIILYRLKGADIEVARVFHNRENWRSDA